MSIRRRNTGGDGIGRARLVAGIVLALAGGCGDDGVTGGAGSSTGSSGEAQGSSTTGHGTTTGTPEASTGSPAPESTEDTGRPADTGTSSGGSTSAEGTSSGSTSSGEGTSSGSTSAGEGTSSGSASVSSGTGTGDRDTGDTDTDTDTDATDTAETGETSECTFSESFDGVPDGSPWPAPWTPSGGVMLADVQGGRGRLLPITGPYALGRMFVPLPTTCVDVEATFTFELSEVSTPGVGLYMRHNGGFLDQTEPPGQGYVAFVQAFGLATGISVWRELDGVETVLAPYVPQFITADTVYKVRFRVTQQDAATTRLQARVWLVEGIEPAVWHVDLTEASPSLQGVGGGFSVDVWSQLQVGVAADVFVDDLEVGPAT